MEGVNRTIFELYFRNVIRELGGIRWFYPLDKVFPILGKQGMILGGKGPAFDLAQGRFWRLGGGANRNSRFLTAASRRFGMTVRYGQR